MALNQLSEKLDQATEHDLGFEFDSVAIWTKLEQRLDDRKRYAYWWVAACILVGLTIFPIGALKESSTPTPAIISQSHLPAIEVLTATVLENTHEPTPLKDAEFTIERKGIDPIQLAQVHIGSMNLQPIAVEKIEKQKPAFAAEDISIIQASLGRPSIEKEKNVTVRAQLHTSAQPIQFNNQVFKIKLFEGSNN